MFDLINNESEEPKEKYKLVLEAGLAKLVEEAIEELKNNETMVVLYEGRGKAFAECIRYAAEVNLQEASSLEVCKLSEYFVRRGIPLYELDDKLHVEPIDSS